MDKLKVLFLTANPEGTDFLEFDEQIRSIREKIRLSDRPADIELISRGAVRGDDLLQALNEHRPHIVHFSGHGTEAHELLVVGNDGQSKPINQQALKALFSTFKQDNIRLVILDACYSRQQAETVVEVIDCAIGMNDAIGETAATIFTASFYRAIGFGRSIKDAFEQGKTALLLAGVDEEEVNMPELLYKPDVDPSALVLVEKTKQDLSHSAATSFHIGELVMGNQTKKHAERDFIEHAENSTITLGNTHIGRDNIVISGNARVENFSTGASFRGDHAQQLLQSVTPQSSKEDILKLLSFVQEELSNMPLPEDVKEEVAHEVKGAEIQLKKDEPDKEKIGKILQTATETLERVPKLTQAAVTVGNLLGQAILWCGEQWVKWGI